MAKYYDIDPETCSIEELEKTIDDVNLKEQQFNTMQGAAKVFLNAAYGSLGATYYNLAGQNINGCTTTDMAASITAQCRDIIKYSARQVNEYFQNDWNNDIDAHKKIADKMKEIYPDFDTERFLYLASHNPLIFSTLQIYGDTDSAYVTLQPIVDACQIPLEQQEHFDVAVYECAMEDMIDQRLTEYAKSLHCPKNLEVFELERISRAGVFLAKKNYVVDQCYLADSKEYLAPLSALSTTGFDTVKGTISKVIRDLLNDFIHFVFEKLAEGRKPNQGEIVKKLRELKTRFVMQSPNDISNAMSISEYDKFVADDKQPGGPIFFELNDKGKKLSVPIHVRAAATYNNLLQTKGSKYLSKYSLLRSGDKVRFYYAKSNSPLDADDTAFGFVPDNFPLEFAPDMNIDKQFEKMVLSPLNRIIVALGYNEIPPTLTYTAGLF